MSAGLKEAMFYDRLDENRVRCGLCRQGCTIADKRRGLCGVRENRNGTLYSRVYARPVSQNVDPIEKKPLYHFLPGSRAFSIGTRGCNFRCLHCQNCVISQVAETDEIEADPVVPPRDIVAAARAYDCAGIAFTYTEPTIFYEYALEIAMLAHEKGIKNVFVTNGYITPDPLERIAPHLDGANIDLKFFRDDLYRRICAARLQPVLDAIRMYYNLGIWIEITTLIIPGYNDDDEQLARIATFIAGVDTNIPWHISAFYPTYKLTDAAPTPAATLRKAHRLGQEAGLKYVYLGNVMDDVPTLCPRCEEPLIRRQGHRTVSNRLADSSCPACRETIAGVWR